MKIEPRRRSDGNAAKVRNALDALLNSATSNAPVCTPDCPKAGSQCSRLCADMPRMLSSERENQPLEEHIAPLIYELKRLEAFTPCWSCEGHNGPDGALWKKPRVWFYCESVVPLRILAGKPKELELAKKLNTPWRVVLTFSDDGNPDTTFSLEPALEQNRPGLAALQCDIDIIAAHLRDGVLAEARKLIKRID
jgi:hypothetical protein